jgi:hypothetical protein
MGTIVDTEHLNFRQSPFPRPPHFTPTAPPYCTANVLAQEGMANLNPSTSLPRSTFQNPRLWGDRPKRKHSKSIDGVSPFLTPPFLSAVTHTLSPRSPSRIMATSKSSSELQTFFQRPPSLSSGTSSSSSSEDEDTKLPASGRKVALSLNLFKETTSEESQLPAYVPSTPSGEVYPLDSMALERPEFEFVKRSAWSDRESAAIKRQRSRTLERVKLSDGNHSLDVDPSEVSKIIGNDLLSYGRGRRRERISDKDSPVTENPKFVPTDLHDRSSSPVPQVPRPEESPSFTSSEKRSLRHVPPPIHIGDYNDASLDHDLSSTLRTTLSRPPSRISISSSSSSHDESDDSSEESTAPTDDEDDLKLNHLQDIPLQPFRNQVGGHKTIYKFTKRAVCKVGYNSNFLEISFSHSFRCPSNSPLFPVRTCSMKRLNMRLLHCWDSSLVIWASCW